jgi:hypothetical protein
MSYTPLLFELSFSVYAELFGALTKSLFQSIRPRDTTQKIGDENAWLERYFARPPGCVLELNANEESILAWFNAND